MNGSDLKCAHMSFSIPFLGQLCYFQFSTFKFSINRIPALNSRATESKDHSGFRGSGRNMGAKCGAVHTLDGSPECAKVSIFLEPIAKTLPAFLLGILDYPLGTSFRPLVVFKGFFGPVPPENVPFSGFFL